LSVANTILQGILVRSTNLSKQETENIGIS